MSRPPFDASKLPREALLAEAFPGQEIKPARNGWARLSCTHPMCSHEHGDRPPHGTPSLDVNVESGAFECRSFNRTGKGWKDFVTTWWGENRWRQVLRDAGYGGRKPASLQERWDDLRPESAWSTSLKLDPALARRYLRSGCRYPGDPRSDTAVALRDGAGQLVGIKWRLPPGGSWKVGSAAKKDPNAKYVLTKGSDPSVIFLAELVADRPGATVLICAGEKDALAAASSLPETWAPVSGCYGEGRVPRTLAELVRGRRVVIAYDGDRAGHEGAWRVARAVARTCEGSPVAALLPEDTPPGARKPGWDVANLLAHSGPQGLEALLAEAGPVPAEWEPKEDSPQGDPPPIEEEEPEAPLFERDAVESSLSKWGELDGCVVRWDNRGRGENARAVAVCCFRGIPRAIRVRTVWTEDPEDPSGWAQAQQVTYRFVLQGGAELDRTVATGSRAFEELLDEVELARACEAVGRTARSQLFLWTLQKSTPEVIEERAAIGPHPGLGWLAPPCLAVRGGRIEDLGAAVVPPQTMQEFRRFRLARLSPKRLRQVARWVVGPLLSCDHADQAYTIPLLGASLSAPLWHAIPELDSWQRHVFWIQGPTGVGKSQLTRYFWSFWGDFVNPSGLANWLSSVTWIEGLLHSAVGVPTFVSDFKRGSFSRDEYRAAMRLIQAYADRTSRGRARRGTAEADALRPPRATWIVDGEDLPEGEASTLGRMVVLRVEAAEGRSLCARAEDSTLSPAMVRDLPGVTAAWIAWTQSNEQALTAILARAVRDMREALSSQASNAARIVRNYAVQLATIRGFCTFLWELDKVQGLEELDRRALDVYTAMAEDQISAVQGETAGESFLDQLRVLIHSGAIYLRPEHACAAQEVFSGFPREGNAVCVGTYDGAGVAHVWPARAVPVVNGSLTRGGGSRIEFSRRAIGQQLSSLGIRVTRRRVSDPGLGNRPRAWTVPLELLGVMAGAASAEEAE